LAYWSAKYNFVYVLRGKVEGLRMTTIVIDQIFSGILIYQVTMAGVFGAYLFTPGVPITLVLAILTIAFRIYLHFRFWQPSKYLPLEHCPIPYGSRKSTLTEEQDLSEYVHPALLPLLSLDQVEPVVEFKKGNIESGEISVADNRHVSSQIYAPKRLSSDTSLVQLSREEEE